MQYELMRSRRRTLAITIDGGGRCVVRAPLEMPLEEIKSFVAEKSGWIKAKLLEIKTKNGLAPEELQLADGAVWTLGGKALRVRLDYYVRRGYICINEDELVASHTVTQRGLIRFLRSFALEDFERRAAQFSKLTGTVPAGIKTSDAGARWGSCSAKNVLNFSWRLIFAPPALIDYVIVHELCHIGCMNHSQDFWRRVAAVLPDFARRRRELKHRGYLLKWFRE